jgi:hypothetical protein
MRLHADDLDMKLRICNRGVSLNGSIYYHNELLLFAILLNGSVYTFDIRSLYVSRKPKGKNEKKYAYTLVEIPPYINYFLYKSKAK